MQGVQGNLVRSPRRDSGSRAKPALLLPVTVPLPNDEGAERKLLSGLLKVSEGMEVAARRGITRASFYYWHHGLVFARLAERTGPHGLFTRLHETKEAAEWPNLPKWIAEIWELDPTGCDCEYMAVLVKRMEVRRNIITRCRVIAGETRTTVHSPETYERILSRL